MLRQVEIHQCNLSELKTYSQISIAFRVESIYRIKDNGLTGIELCEEKVKNPYIKDYDTAKGEGPTRWFKRFDVSDWAIFRVFEDGRAVGGAVVAPGFLVGDLDKRFSQLFDIRVEPEKRGTGIGTLLLKNVNEYLRRLDVKYLKIETQNTNVPACKFYRQQGCSLGSIERYAYHDYADVEHEVRLLWYLTL